MFFFFKVHFDMTAVTIQFNKIVLNEVYWSGLPFPSPRDLPDSGIEPRSPTLKADSLLSGPPNFSQAFRPFLKHLKSFTHPFRHFLEGGEEKHSCAF